MKIKSFALTIIFSSIILSGFAAAHASKLPAAGIATAHPMATEAGHIVLEAGGNAFDAAVAISASLAVVEPMSSGLGGGGFWLLHRESDGFETMIDGREMAPAKAHRDMYLDKNGDVIPGASMDGPLSAGIPGIPAGIVHLAKKYGRLPLAKSLEPAIQQAEDGFIVDTHYQRMAKFRLDALRASPAAAKIFLHKNDVPDVGSIIKQPVLAKTLKLIAKHGNDGFYQGHIAKKLVDGANKAGGVWQLADLKNYKIIEREPIRGEYRGMKITSAAPPSSGGIAIMSILNMLAGFDLTRLSTKLSEVQQRHLIIEAMRRAYRDRAIYLGDPDFVNVPMKKLLDKDYASELRASIKLDKATPSASLPGGIDEGPKGEDTTHFSVIDKDGNRVSATLTVNYPFGSCFVAPGTGVLLNDEMDDFSAKPGVPNAYGLVGAEANAIAAGKRPLSSMSPTFIENDRGVVVIGTPGGSRIITMVLLAILDYANGGTAESMVKLPRYHHQYLPDQVQFEKGALDDDLMSGLSELGHQFKQVGWAYGNMHAVVWDKQSGKLEAASDPRYGGKAEVR